MLSQRAQDVPSVLTILFQGNLSLPGDDVASARGDFVQMSRYLLGLPKCAAQVYDQQHDGIIRPNRRGRLRDFVAGSAYVV